MNKQPDPTSSNNGQRPAASESTPSVEQMLAALTKQNEELMKTVAALTARLDDKEASAASTTTNGTNGANAVSNSMEADWLLRAAVGVALFASAPGWGTLIISAYIFKNRQSIRNELSKGVAAVKGLFSPAAKALTASKDSAKIHLANTQYTAINAKNAAVNMAKGSGSKIVNKLGEVKTHLAAKKEAKEAAKKAEAEAAAAPAMETTAEAAEETTTSKPGQAAAFVAPTASQNKASVALSRAMSAAVWVGTSASLWAIPKVLPGVLGATNPVVANIVSLTNSNPIATGAAAIITGSLLAIASSHLIHKKMTSAPAVKKAQKPNPEKKPSSVLTKMKSPWMKRIAATAVTVGLVTVASLGYIQCSPKGDNDQKLKVTANTPKVESVAPAVNTTDAELAAREAKLAKLPETQSTVDTKTETAGTAQVEAEKSDAGKKVAAEVKKSSDNKAKVKTAKAAKAEKKGKKVAKKSTKADKTKTAKAMAAAEKARRVQATLAKMGADTAKKSPAAAVSGTTAHLVDRSEANPMGTYVGEKERTENTFVGVTDNDLNSAHQLKTEAKDAKNEKGGLLSWLFGKSAEETTEKKITDKGDGYTSWLDRYFGEKAKAEAAAAEAAKNNPTKAVEKAADGEKKVAAAKVVTGKVNKDELRRNHFVDGRKTHKNVESSAPTEAKVAETPAKAAAGTTVVEKSGTPENGSTITEAGQHTSMWEKFKAAASKVLGTQKAAAEPTSDEKPKAPEPKRGPEPILSGPSVSC